MINKLSDRWEQIEDNSCDVSSAWRQIEFSKTELKEIDECIQSEKIGLLDHVFSFLWEKIGQIFQVREKKVYKIKELWTEEIHIVEANSFEEALKIVGLSPMDVFSTTVYD